jgi:hypothetical protein
MDIDFEVSLLGLLDIAVAVICYAAGWWQARTIERARWEERAAAQGQLVQREQQVKSRRRSCVASSSSAAFDSLRLGHPLPRSHSPARAQ